MKIKVCGVGNVYEMKSVVQKIDIIGFNFYPPSLRYFAHFYENVEEIARFSKNGIKTAGIFVNAPVQSIVEYANSARLDYLQLHGDESAEDVEFIVKKGLEVIKAFSLSPTFDFRILERYSAARYFLFDTPTPDYGGSGKKFDWNLIGKYTLDTPYFLAGGIDSTFTLENILLEDNRLFGLDINSRFEYRPGIKNFPLIESFINRIKHEHNDNK